MCKILIPIIITLPLLLAAQNKSQYDLQIRNLAKSLAISSEISPEYLLTGSEYLEISLTNQGYFTIGTNSGASESTLDDNCQITFGHPYALTSFPVFSLDGNWYRFEDYFTQPESTALYQEAATLMLEGNNGSGLSISFSMVAQSETPAIEFILKIKNNDSISHNISPGLILDPAIGKWGDAILMNGNTTCLHDTVMDSDQISPPIQLWEKISGARGIGAEVKSFSDVPDRIVLANWHDVYNNISPSFELSELRELYDLVMKLYWPSIQLEAEEEFEIHCELMLTEPDFSKKVFTRWDLPNFLTIENGIMFPGKMMTTLESKNAIDQTLENIKLNLHLPETITTTAQFSEFSLESGSNTYQPIDLNAKLIYENRIFDIKADITENNTVVESIHRKLFVPATPVSDTGLVVINDSLSIDQFPQVEVIFSIENHKTGQRILDLSAENIFLYENQLRIQDFSLGKYSDGGSNLADVVFVLDVSGSMGDEKDQVVAYLEEFADSLEMRGFDYQIGLVTFSTELDKIVDLTTNIEYIRQVLNSISLWGGVEDSPLALYTASEMSFRNGSRRNIIWITDEEYPEHSYTVEQVVNRMLSMDITVHGVGLLSLQTDWFNPIVIPTGGNFYNIDGNFRDILLDVTRFEAQDRYQLEYQSSLSASTAIDLKLEVHYAGLGVLKTYSFSSKGATQSDYNLLCYPNPFNPEITLQLKKPPNLSGQISIYNMLGQIVRLFELPEVSTHKIVWDGRNLQGQHVGSGFYIVQLILRDPQGIRHRESTRILHLK
jgi:Mg-chelatase subunit ChlD